VTLHRVPFADPALEASQHLLHGPAERGESGRRLGRRVTAGAPAIDDEKPRREPGDSLLIDQPVRKADRAGKMGRRVRRGAARIDQVEVPQPSGECRGDIVGIGLDRQLLDEVGLGARGIATVRATTEGLETACSGMAAAWPVCEPCPMCHAAAILAGVSRIVYAAPKETAARHGFALTGIAAAMQSTRRAKRLDPVEHVAIEGADEPFARFDERAPGVKFGVNFINSGPGTTADTAARWAGTGEAVGYDLLMVSDHVAITPDVAHYPAPFFDTPATLGWLAANTTRIELGTTVMLLPLRHVLDTARIVGTVDQLAGGRLTALGVGLGWAWGEFEALGVPFERRGAITDDYLTALRELWSSDLASYDGACARVLARADRAPPIQHDGDLGGRRSGCGAPASRPLRRRMVRSRSRSTRSPSVWNAARDRRRGTTADAVAGAADPAAGDRAATRRRPGSRRRDAGSDSDLAALESLGAAFVILDPFVPRADGHAAHLAEIERMAAEIIELR
jgi:alkanesulfonate monooxygenase SsuD/methylene tetrahydromethanopterin reductase-like flavin-dependent oxidoreductase (luciferase family)